jgi:ribose 5-phosphate isomerase B
MKIAVGTDEHMHLVDVLLEELAKRGHVVQYFGPAKGAESMDWPDVTLEAVTRVSDGTSDEAIILCWTGTGCSIAANKVAGIRAALCGDAETAKGARTWNHANVLALSLRSISEGVLRDILEAWFDTPMSTDEWNLDQMKKIQAIERSQILSADENSS